MRVTAEQYGVVPLRWKDNDREWFFKVCEISPEVLATRAPLCVNVLVSVSQVMRTKEVRTEPNRDEVEKMARSVALEWARLLGAELIVKSLCK